MNHRKQSSRRRMSDIPSIAEKLHCKSTERRRMSDFSIASGRSYISPNSSIYETIDYEAKQSENIYFKSFPNNTPPPLPRRFSRISEEIDSHESVGYSDYYTELQT